MQIDLTASTPSNGAQPQPDESGRRLRLAVAARNFGDTPIDESLRRIAEIGFDACDNFDWRDENTFTAYREGLRRYGLSAGVLVVNKKPDVNALGCSLVDPAERSGFLHELELCVRPRAPLAARNLRF